MSAQSKRPIRHERGDVLEGGPLHYAPRNELGVVFLFAHMAKRWRLTIDSIQAGFPDCIASQKTQHGTKRVRIEFEYKSRSFRDHGHSPRGCDWIVCWEHNWPEAPRHLRIVELRREFGLGFNVWIVPIKPDPYKEVLHRNRTETWSVHSQGHKGDLILFYMTKPEGAIEFVFRMTGRAMKQTASWKPGLDHFATVSKVMELKAPIFFEDLRRDRVLRTASFVRAQFQARANATEYWPYLYDLIVRRNPEARRTLAKYAPEQLG